MVERELLLDRSVGQQRLYCTRPDLAGEYPLVLLLMDAPGYRPELQSMARRLAGSGFAVAVPDLYFRTIRGFGRAAVWPDPVTLPEPADRDERARREWIYRHMHATSLEQVASDLPLVLAALADDPSVRADRMGVVGYCMSGPLALGLAARAPERIAAAASIHGVKLISARRDSPHRLLSSIRAELYFGCAEFDDWAPRELIDSLSTALYRAGSRYRIDWYPGTEHGFVFPTRDRYCEAAADRHWAVLVDLFRRALTPASARAPD
ncbi:MAG: dienelactone hydrolase family protein [Pseudomonadota bacterium]